MRFEEPSSMVRWDSPLFTVPWTDEDVPGDGIWKAITEGTVKPPNTGTQAVRRFPSYVRTCMYADVFTCVRLQRRLLMLFIP